MSLLTTGALAAPRFALATSTGAALVSLVVHVLAGITGVATGFFALAVAKGGRAHRAGGRAFVYAMVVMGVVGAAIATVERKPGSVDGGLLAAYFVVSALLTVRPPTIATRRMEIGGMLVALGVGLANIALGGATLAAGGHGRDGVPLPMYFVFGAIALAAAGGDARLVWFTRPRGPSRLVRHLWRMCFALFIASGSFFLGQAHLFPKAIRIYSVLAVPALAPLVIMLYWLWRVRMRRSLRGLTVARAIEPA